MSILRTRTASFRGVLTAFVIAAAPPGSSVTGTAGFA